MNINLVESLFCYTFAPDKSHLDRLVAHCRVFFDKRSGKAERIECNLEQNVELRTVSKSSLGPKGRLQGKNPVFPQFPRLPLFKEIQQILTKLQKVESKTKKYISFFAETE